MVGTTVLTVALWLSASWVSANPQSVLDRPLEPTARKATINARADALVEWLLVSRVPVVFEESAGPWVSERWITTEEWGPIVTVRDVLSMLVRLDPRYDWRETADGIVIVRPTSSWTDPKNDLNRRVRDFSFLSPADGPDQMRLLDALTRILVPSAVRVAPLQSLSEPSPVITLDLHDVTVLDVLVAAVKADGEIGFLVNRRFHGGPEAGQLLTHRTLGMCHVGMPGWCVPSVVLK